MGGIFLAGLAVMLGVEAGTPALSERVLRPIPLLGGTPVAQIREPRAVAWDPVRGWIWVADANAGRIVALDEAGQPVRWTRATHPVALALAPDGTLFSLEGSRVVRRTRRLEMLSSRFAPTPTPSALAVGPDGSVWVADADAGRVEPHRAPGDGFHADAPTGIAFDASGDLWVADAAERVLYRVSGASELERIRLPASPLRMYAPLGISAREGGGVLVVDSARAAVYEVESGRIQNTRALPGAVLPEGVAAGPHGVAFVVDRLRSGLQRIPLYGGPIETLADSEGGDTVLDRPISLATGPGEPSLWVVDRGRERLLQIDRAGRLVGSSELPGVRHLSPSAAEGIWVATEHGEVLRLDPDLGVLHRLPLEVRASALLSDGAGGVWAALAGEGVLIQIDAEGRERARIRPLVSEFFFPHDLAHGPEGSLWVLDALHGAVWRLDPAGRMLARARCTARSVTSDPEGGLWLVDTETRHVRHLGPDGTEIDRYPIGRGLNADDVAALRMGPDGTLWAADDARHRVLRLVPGAPDADAR
jgi:streptogramin lyase